MVTYRVVGWLLLWRVISRSRLLRARLRESSDVLTRVAVGVLRPVVILPAGWRAWNTNTLRVVLAHEFAHLRRHDTLVSAMARMAQCVLWFHPLAWWLSRKISDLAELACDAVVLERVDDPAGYSRILLEFADAVNRAGRRVALPGLAMAAGSRMGRRIDQVFELSGGLSNGKLRERRVRECC
jgi:beta-lactamase regulating signal transducer with metallopeptidase domain